MFIDYVALANQVDNAFGSVHPSVCSSIGQRSPGCQSQGQLFGDLQLFFFLRIFFFFFDFFPLQKSVSYQITITSSMYLCVSVIRWLRWIVSWSIGATRQAAGPAGAADRQGGDPWVLYRMERQTDRWTDKMRQCLSTTFQNSQWSEWIFCLWSKSYGTDCFYFGLQNI